MPVRCPPPHPVSSSLSPTRRSHSFPARESTGEKAATNSIAFFLFILLNAVLFIRPAEIVPDLLGLPIYEWVILACLAASAPGVLAQLKPRSLYQQPITVCVLGLLPAIVLSHLAHGNLFSARWTTFEFFKVVVYYLLLVANVSTASRLRQFLVWLVVLIGGLAVLALLQYHGEIDISALAPHGQRELDLGADPESILLRLQSAGLYNDPNDLCLILLTGMGICLYWITDRWLGWLRFLPVVLVGIFGFTLYLTYSRGGFLALMAGLVYLFRSRFGWGKTIVLSALVVPLAFVVFAGRQTQLDISDRGDTGQSRVLLWSEGLELFRQAPLFGIGKDEYSEQVQHVAHNSFLHCFTELGFGGGMLFLGTFYCAFVMLHLLGSDRFRILDPGMIRFRPYLMASVAGYAAGLLSLSRPYVVTTYMILGLVTAFASLGAANRSVPLIRFNARLLLRMATASVAYLVATYGVVRIFAQWG